MKYIKAWFKYIEKEGAREWHFDLQDWSWVLALALTALVIVGLCVGIVLIFVKFPWALLLLFVALRPLLKTIQEGVKKHL